MEGWRNFRACLNARGCTTGPLVDGEDSSNKISVLYFGGTMFQCPGIEVGLLFQDPCWGEGLDILVQMSRRGMEILGPICSGMGDTLVLL